MVKNFMSEKIQKAITIQNLIKQNVPTKEIMKRFKVSRQYIHY